MNQHSLTWRRRPPVPILGIIALVVGELALLVGYFRFTPAESGAQLRYLLYPFVWINTSVLAVWTVSPTPRNRVHRWLGALVGIVYFLAVMAVPGNIGLGVPGTEPAVRIGWYAPGWGPLVAVVSPWIRLYLVPFEVVGYLALSFLVYANTVALTRGTLSSLLGLATCVGCTVPLIAPLVGLLGGPAAGLVTTAYQWSYDLGTVIFVVSVGLLVVSHPD